MTLQKQIKTINDLRSKMWPASALFNIEEFDHLLATLIEEAGELRQAVRSFFGRPFSPEKSAERKHIIEELGDVLVPVIALSNQMEIPFEEALDAAIKKLNNRLLKKQESDRLDAMLKRDQDNDPYKSLRLSKEQSFQTTFNNMGGVGKNTLFPFDQHQPFQWDPQESPK